MKNIDSNKHVRGESLYIEDIPVREGTLYAAVFGAPVAHGKIRSLDLSEALKSEGVVKILTAKDIPGQNQIGSIIQDEPLLADEEIHFMYMPVAVVLAETEALARRALPKIKIEVEELPVVVCPRQAHAKGDLIVPSRTFSLGDASSIWDRCDHIIEESASMGGQEHAYLETQGSYAYPLENGNLMIHSSTQAPSYVQKGVMKVLGIPMHRIEVDVIRLGGAFGGKEDQGTPWASMAAMGAQLLQKPVKLVLHRLDDMRMTGKRHPYQFDFKIGLDKDLKILGYEVTCFQNGGASADVSSAVMERTLFHGNGSYFIPNCNITVHSCRTNLPPNTAFRGFGAPQAVFAMESAIYKAASVIGVDASEIQRANLLVEEQSFPFGQLAKNCQASKCWDDAFKTYDYKKIKKEVDDFNKKNTNLKKGIAVLPLCFGISFTKTSLNQGRSLVHIYSDGSVSITTGVIEMGQGVNTKIIQVAATVLGINENRITVHSTNTTRIANASPTAASTGADLNGRATEIACDKLLGRLLCFAGKELGLTDLSNLLLKDEKIYIDGQATELDWQTLIFKAHEDRVNISEHAHYATPIIHFDKATEKGHAFSYHVYGTAITVAKVDCLRAVSEIESVKIVHDFGRSMNLDIDMGQVEGALAQGIGLMTIEELLFNEKGKMVYDSFSSYKIPDIYSIPQNVEITALDCEPDELAIFGSKAVGEPPLLYGISAYFAIINAMREFDPNVTIDLSAPITYQKMMLALFDKDLREL